MFLFIGYLYGYTLDSCVVLSSAGGVVGHMNSGCNRLETFPGLSATRMAGSFLREYKMHMHYIFFYFSLVNHYLYVHPMRSMRCITLKF
jgi:hypothetical protein